MEKFYLTNYMKTIIQEVSGNKFKCLQCKDHQIIDRKSVSKHICGLDHSDATPQSEVKKFETLIAKIKQRTQNYSTKFKGNPEENLQFQRDY